MLRCRANQPVVVLVTGQVRGPVNPASHSRLTTHTSASQRTRDVPSRHARPVTQVTRDFAMSGYVRPLQKTSVASAVILVMLIRQLSSVLCFCFHTPQTGRVCGSSVTDDVRAYIAVDVRGTIRWCASTAQLYSVVTCHVDI